MLITLMQAVNIRSRIEKEFKELHRQRNLARTVTRKENETNDQYVTVSVESLTDKIITTKAEYIAINDIITASNLKPKITIENGDDKTIASILSAIKMAGFYREEGEYLKILGSERKLSRDTYSDGDLVTAVTYDLEWAKKEGERLSKLAEKISYLVDMANIETIVEVPFADKYI